MGELVLQVFANLLVIPDEVPHFEEQIDKIQRTRFAFCFIVVLDQLAHFLLQKGREIGVRIALEILQSPHEHAAQLVHLLAGSLFCELRPAGPGFLAQIAEKKQ